MIWPRGRSCAAAFGELLVKVVARLQKLGIDTSERSASEKVKTVMITDLDGNHIAFAEAIVKGMAR